MGSYKSRHQLPAYAAASAPPKGSCKSRHELPAYDAASAPPVERPPETPTTFRSIGVGARSVLFISSQDGDFIGAYEGEGGNARFRIMAIAPSAPQ